MTAVIVYDVFALSALIQLNHRLNQRLLLISPYPKLPEQILVSSAV